MAGIVIHLAEIDYLIPLKEQLDLLTRDLHSAKLEITEHCRSVRCKIDYSTELSIKMLEERRMKLIGDVYKYEKHMMAKFENEFDKKSMLDLIDECSRFIQDCKHDSIGELERMTLAFQKRLDEAACQLEASKFEMNQLIDFEPWEPVTPTYHLIGTLHYKKRRLDEILRYENDIKGKIYSLEEEDMLHPIQIRDEPSKQKSWNRFMRLGNGKYYSVHCVNSYDICIGVYDRDLRFLEMSKTLVTPFHHADMRITMHSFKNKMFICWTDRSNDDALTLLISVDQELNIVSRNDSLTGNFNLMIRSSELHVLVLLKKDQILLLDNDLNLLHRLHIPLLVDYELFNYNIFDMTLLDQDPAGVSHCLLFQSSRNYFQLLKCLNVTGGEYQSSQLSEFVFKRGHSKRSSLITLRYVMYKFDDLDYREPCHDAIKYLVCLFCQRKKKLYFVDCKRDVVCFVKKVELEFDYNCHIRILQLTRDFITFIDDNNQKIYEYKLSLNFDSLRTQKKVTTSFSFY